MSQGEQPVYVCEQVREVERLHRDLLTDTVRRLPIRDQLDRQANRILDAHQAGDRAIVPQITCWHPRLACHSADDIMNSAFTPDDARQTIAREYGFTDWLHAAAEGGDPPDADFELAVDTLLRGDVETLRVLLAGDPRLIHRRSRYGHRSTLLHYVGSNGVETYRQRVPLNLAEITRLLVEAGADVNAPANMYGGGSTTLGLLATSDHPAKAGVTDDVRKVLEEAAARRR
ncbi:hypothetical protein [Planctomyces sp. SH-PL14]|uniref:hypothetical protein n=1 Tax=Planctomyces sp. SH-PL14 TaxID=1632864 RepID=UPI00078D3677|nr:hypothetical protein [Planctomyces sp. SH-PL14]AMV22477.1 hypothetical protein VT03_31570 [Planctomyces sp. SH-PL14]